MDDIQKIKLGPLTVRKRTYLIVKTVEVALILAGSVLSFLFLRHQTFWFMKYLWLILLGAAVIETVESAVIIRFSQKKDK